MKTEKTLFGCVWVAVLAALSLFATACSGGCSTFSPNCRDDAQCAEYARDPTNAGFGLGMDFCVDQICRECRTSTDCEGACAECRNNSCAIRGGCEADDDCPTGQICQNCGCQPGCRTDDMCGGSLFCCPNFRCCDCLTDQDCPYGYLCEDGTCYDVVDRCFSRRLGSVYFDFDSSIIRAGDEPALEYIQVALESCWPGDNIIIEGHCDERGTEAYNQTLGERRARAARDHLLRLGVDDDRIIDIVSYGETQPAAEGHDEGAWRQNRRVEFVWD